MPCDGSKDESSLNNSSRVISSLLPCIQSGTIDLVRSQICFTKQTVQKVRSQYSPNYIRLSLITKPTRKEEESASARVGIRCKF